MLTPKFDIGDSVYTIYQHSVAEKIPCLTCNGKKTITYKKEIFSCPKCFGTGFHTEYKTRWNCIRSSSIITEIHITREEILYIFAMDSTSPHIVLEKNCFLTLGEAIQACKNRNSLEECK